MKQSVIDLLLHNKKALYFVLKLVGLYLLLQGIYDYYITPYTTLDNWLINFIITGAEWGLLQLGFELLPANSLYTHHLGIAGTSGVIIGTPCDGLSLFILFTSFVVIFKGKWWSKSLFILPGILLIHFLNVIRVVALAIVVKYSPDYLDFHHSYTFTLFVYLCIFLLWVFRIKVYEHKKL